MPGKGLRHCSAITHAPITSDFCSCKECYCWTSSEFMEKAMFYQWWPCAFTFRGIHFPLVFIKKALCSKGQPAEIHNTIAYTKDIPHSPVLFHVLGWSLRWDTLISVLRCFISSLWFYYSPVWFRTAMGFTLWGGSVAPNPRHQELCITLHVCSLCVWGAPRDLLQYCQMSQQHLAMHSANVRNCSTRNWMPNDHSPPHFP